MSWKALVPFALMLALAGCRGEVSPPDPNAGRSTANGDDRPSIVPVTVDPESIRVTDWRGVEQLVAQHEGHVVVVYLWATFNQPSVNEFPQFVRLCKSHPDDLRCISFSVDFDEGREGGEPAEVVRSEVAQFLGQQGADFEHALSSIPAEELYEQIDLVTGIPAVYVFDRNGELARRFDQDDPEQPEFSFRREVTPFVEELVRRR